MCYDVNWETTVTQARLQSTYTERRDCMEKEEIKLRFKLQGLHTKQRIVNTRDSFAANGSVSSILLYDLGMARRNCFAKFYKSRLR